MPVFEAERSEETLTREQLGNLGALTGVNLTRTELDTAMAEMMKADAEEREGYEGANRFRAGPKFPDQLFTVEGIRSAQAGPGAFGYYPLIDRSGGGCNAAPRAPITH